MRLVVASLGVFALLGSVVLARPAHAFERQWHVGAAGGVAAGDGLKLSPALGAYAAYGLSDVFDVRVEVTARGYELGRSEDPHAVAAAAGLVYKLDVLRWVPWGGVYAGYLGFLRSPREELRYRQHDALLGFGLGLDYAYSRGLGLGITLRTDLPVSVTAVAQVDALLRVEYRWGF